MASKLPVLRQVAWFSLLPQFVIMTSIGLLFYLFSPQNLILKSAVCYLLLSFVLRTVIPMQHRRGIRLVKKKQFKEAIPFFQSSAQFFTKYKWVDRYRFITLLSSSRISYLEMAMLNEAFCLSQIEKRTEAVEKYEEVLTLFPESEIALTALKMMGHKIKE